MQRDNTDDPFKIYFDALDRLKSNKPTKVPKGTRITNDSVSIEAGRGKGSIKKSRHSFQRLIAAINEAADEQSAKKPDGAEMLSKAREKIQSLQFQLDNALAREMSLVYELFELRKHLRAVNGEKVSPIRRSPPIVNADNTRK